jgi:hypothetical protein
MQTAKRVQRRREDPVLKLEAILLMGLNQKLGTQLTTAYDMATYLDTHATARRRLRDSVPVKDDLQRKSA